MKKILLVLVCILFTKTMIGQVIWSSDFSKPSDWTITNNSATGSLNWVITSTMPTSAGIKTWLASANNAFNSTSKGNFALVDASTVGSGTRTAIITTTNPISTIGKNNLIVNFNQLYARWQDVASVEVSTDNSTWTPFTYNNKYTSNQSTANSENVSIDITSVAANKSSVWVRFKFVGTANDYDFAWFVDDFSIEEIPENDLRVLSGYITGQTQAIQSCLGASEIGVYVINKGLKSVISGTPVSYKVNSNSIVTESASWLDYKTKQAKATLVYGDTALYVFSTKVDLSAELAYAIKAFVSLPSDQSVSNDTVTLGISNLVAKTVDNVSSYNENFEVGKMNGFTVEDVDKRGYKFGVANTGNTAVTTTTVSTAAACLRISEPTGKVDDWAFSPCLHLKPGYLYTLSYYTRLSANLPNNSPAIYYAGNIELKLGKTASSSGMSQSISSSQALTPDGKYVKITNTFSVTEPDVYHIGFHVTNTDTSKYTAVRVDDISLTARNLSNEKDILACKSDDSNVNVNVSSDQIKVTISEGYTNKQIGFTFQSSPYSKVKFDNNDVSGNFYYVYTNPNQVHQIEVTAEDGTTKQYSLFTMEYLPSITSINCDSIQVQIIDSSSYRATRNAYLKASGNSFSTTYVTAPSNSDTLLVGREISGIINAAIRYTGGNGQPFIERSVLSSGVTGLKATLKAGNLANGSGTLLYQITGKPENAGVANFPIDFGGQSCNFSITVIENTAKSNACDILSFKFNTPSTIGSIKGSTIYLTVPAGTNVSNLVASFTVSAYASVQVGSNVQVSGQTPNNFSDTVSYILIAEDGTIKNYNVIVNVQQIVKSSACDITSFGFSNPSVVGTISGTNIALTVPVGTNVTNLIANFTISPKATVKVGSINQVSGQTSNNFTLPISYVVIAEDGVTTNSYSVNVSVNEIVSPSSNTVIDTLKFIDTRKTFGNPSNNITSSNNIGYKLKVKTALEPKTGMDFLSFYQTFNSAASIKCKGVGIVLRSLNTVSADVDVTFFGKTEVGGQVKSLGTITKNIPYNSSYNPYAIQYFMLPNSISILDTFSFQVAFHDVKDSIEVLTTGYYGQKTQATASISGTTLTATSFVNTGFVVGQEIFGLGVVPGTRILDQKGTNTFTVNISQTVSSTTITASTVSFTDNNAKLAVKNISSKGEVIDSLFEIFWNPTENKAYVTDIYMYPIVEYNLISNPKVDNKCLDKSKEVNVVLATNHEIIRNPLFNKMAAYIQYLGKTKADNYYYTSIDYLKDKSKILIDGNSQTTDLTKVYTSDLENDTISITDYLWTYARLSPVKNQKTTFLISSKISPQVKFINASLANNNGQASVNVSGGHSPYTYLWNINRYTSNQITVPSGVYRVKVTDVNGCNAISDSVVVSSVASNEKSILSFSINGIEAKISETTIKIILPVGTDLNLLIPKFTVSSNALVKVGKATQVSGITSNNFNNILSYTVIAEDGSSKIYSVAVEIAPKSSACDLIAFTVINPNITGVISGTTISLTVPTGTNITNLIANFNISPQATVKVGSTIQISGQTANDFTNQVMYVVTAEDGSTKTYTVVVQITNTPKSSAKDFISFSISNPSVTATIYTANMGVDLLVAAGADLTKAIINFTVSPGATLYVNNVKQVSGLSTINLSPIYYDVIAEDGTKKSYRLYINYERAIISGQKTLCINASSLLTASSQGSKTQQNWAISDTSIAKITPNGVVTAIKTGKSVVTFYSINEVMTVDTIYVLPTSISSAGSITGKSDMCMGEVVALSVNNQGGFWSSSDTTIATIDGKSGQLTAKLDGQSEITYTIPGSSKCDFALTKLNIVVHAPLDVLPIEGVTTFCKNSSTNLSSQTNLGTWESNNTSVASVDANGKVSGLAAGTSKITYTVSQNGCTSATTTNVEIIDLPLIPAITGNTDLCTGSSAQLSNALKGGVWLTNDSSVVTIDSNGVMTPIKLGVSEIIYRVTENGCTSYKTIVAYVKKASSSTETKTACTSYNWNNQTYTKSGVYTYTTNNKVGCDSLVTLHLTIDSVLTQTEKQTVCGEYTWHGKTYTQSGTYVDSLKTTGGCDSIVTLDLTIATVLYGTETKVTCNDFTWHGKTYSQSGSYVDTMKTQAGCDSIVTLNLTIKSVSTSTLSVTACGSYIWNKQTYLKSGIYTHATKTLEGCDSIAILNLTMGNGVSVTETKTACASFTWHGTTYTQSGTYVDSLKTPTGCDSIVTLNLKLQQAVQAKESKITCGAYTWHGKIYSQSGSYVDTMKTQAGCDSIVTLYLTIKSVSTSTENIAACGSYVWNKQTYLKSGIYTHATKTLEGCDSIAILNLTIHTGVSSTHTKTACGVFSWLGKTYTQSGTYVDSLKTIIGCDSVVTLKLTINQGVTATESKTACGVFVWHGKTFTQSGTYVDTLQTSLGCDSIVTLNLTVNPIPEIASILGDTSITVGLTSPLSVATTSGTWFSLDASIAEVTAQGVVTGVKVGTALIRFEVTANGCMNTKTIQVVVAAKTDTATTGLQTMNATGMKVYPNPFVDKIQIALDQVGDYQIQVYDLTGKILTDTRYENTKTIKLNLEHIASGEYVLKVIHDQFVETRKLTK